MQSNRVDTKKKQDYTLYISKKDFPNVKKMGLEDKGQISLIGAISAERKVTEDDSDMIEKTIRITEINSVSKKARAL